jgi:sterol-4alpha-carboxylate 3-dehydrogenase (decarboxylating)
VRHHPSKIATEKTGKAYLVVGGHGLLGSHVVEGLLARGERNIHVYDRTPSSLFDDEVASGLVTFHQGDILDRARLTAACRRIDTVIHTAASVNYWADLPFEYAPIHAVNFTGTRNVIDACGETGVRQLLHTSSTSVVVGRDPHERPIAGADESLPYASPPHLCHYIATKILAERAVLEANGPSLATAALRPGGMYGPRDELLCAGIRKGDPGVGLRDNVIDHVYVENVVHAFLKLEQRLTPGSPVAGRAYFVTNYSPAVGQSQCDSYYDFNSRLARAFGQEFRLGPRWLFSALAATSQTLIRASRGRLERPLGQLARLRPATLALARATYHFSHARASRDFGYDPLYSVDEAVALTAAWWAHGAAGRFGRIASQAAPN